MTDHDDDELAALLDAIDARHLPESYEPAVDPPEDQAAAIRSGAVAAGIDPASGRFYWLTTRSVVLDADGMPAGVEVHRRRLVFTNCPVTGP
jgi:hypothetical protein